MQCGRDHAGASHGHIGCTISVKLVMHKLLIMFYGSGPYSLDT